jgi:hypothetical protein
MEDYYKHSVDSCVNYCYFPVKGKKGKVIPIQAVESFRVARGWGSTFSAIRLIDGGNVVSPIRRPIFNPRKIPGTHFC